MSLKTRLSHLVVASHLCNHRNESFILMNSIANSIVNRFYSTEVKASSSSCPYHQKQQSGNVIKSYHEIPGPKGYPLIGNALDFVKNSNNISAFFMKLADTYGDMVKLTMFRKKFVLLSNPILFEQLIRMEERRPIIETLRYLKEQKGLPMSPVHMRFDEPWQDIRQLFNIAMKPEFQEQVTIPQLTELNGDFLRRIIQFLEKEGDEKYRLHNGVEAVSRYGFDAVLKVFLGVRMTEEVTNTFPFPVSDFVNTTLKSIDAAVKIDQRPPIYKYYKTKEFKELEALAQKAYEYGRYCVNRFYKNETDKPRLLELLQERAKDIKGEDIPTRLESVMTTFLQAAVDVTMRLLVNTMYRIAHEPGCQEKIYQECLEVFGEPTLDEITSENGLQITAQQYKKLKYVRNFLDEVTRMDSFSYMTQGRVMHQDRELGGYMIPKETNILVLQRKAILEDQYVPQAHEFIPERYEKGSGLAMANNYVNTPFGVGARKCPGSRIATTELVFGIVNIVRHFKLSHENQSVMPEPSFAQALLVVDLEKTGLYFTPREHLKEYVKNTVKK